MSGLAEDFEAFWAVYPRKTGKLVALREYTKARRLASAAEILAGVERFRLNLPEEARYIPHPRTWLYQGRWLDEDDAPVLAPPKVECPHQPRCNSKDWCSTMRAREAEGWQRDSVTGQWRQTA